MTGVPGGERNSRIAAKKPAPSYNQIHLRKAGQEHLLGNVQVHVPQEKIPVPVVGKDSQGYTRLGMDIESKYGISCMSMSSSLSSHRCSGTVP